MCQPQRMPYERRGMETYRLASLVLLDVHKIELDRQQPKATGLVPVVTYPQPTAAETDTPMPPAFCR